jgi:tagaturonate reductase
MGDSFPPERHAIVTGDAGAYHSHGGVVWDTGCGSGAERPRTDGSGEFPTGVSNLRRLNRSVVPSPVRRERVLQFGTGNFLRGFADWMIDGLNSRGLFDGGIVVVQATTRGLASKFNAQEGLYTVLLRGIDQGRLVEDRRVVTAITRALDPHTQFDSFLECARNPDLRFIVSNTTEAGIAFNPNDRLTDRPPAGFPGKLTVFLLERYRTLPDRGFIVLPCELIERNGERLRHVLIQTAQGWGVDGGFIEWITAANVFADTLVDRIVPGYPHEEARTMFETWGYMDELLVAGEPFHFFAIAPRNVARELPLDQAGFNVVFADDITPYRERKVRILNGSHTSVALAAFLAGKDTVKECMDDPVLREFVETVLRTEIGPTLTLPAEEVSAFIDATLDRYSNPHLKHLLLSISLYSVSKFRARLVPVIRKYVQLKGEIPIRVAFALAALIAFYRGTEIRDAALIGFRTGHEYRIQDEPGVLEIFAGLWSAPDTSPATLTDAVLGQTAWWDCDLREIPGLTAAVSRHLTVILTRGVPAALDQILS